MSANIRYTQTLKFEMIAKTKCSKGVDVLSAITIIITKERQFIKQKIRSRISFGVFEFKSKLIHTNKR